MLAARLLQSHALRSFPPWVKINPCRTKHSSPSIQLTIESSEQTNVETRVTHSSTRTQGRQGSSREGKSKPEGSCWRHSAIHKTALPTAAGWLCESSCTEDESNVLSWSSNTCTRMSHQVLLASDIIFKVFSEGTKANSSRRSLPQSRLIVPYDVKSDATVPDRWKPS